MRRADLVLAAIPGIVLAGLVLEWATRAIARAGSSETLLALSDAVSFTLLGFVAAMGLIVNETVRAPTIDR